MFIVEHLENYYDELTPYEFYRGIFPEGELAYHSKEGVPGKFNAIAVELLPKENKTGNNARRYLLTDELDYLEKLLKKDNFIIISPISYCGRTRESKNARYIYAIAIDLDGLTEESNLAALFHQMEYEYLPTPTYIMWSGTGCHLYYVFEQAIPCYENIVKQLTILKNALTRKIWNKEVTKFYEKPQIESLFQGFRLCGGITKNGNRTRAFEINKGKKVTIEYLNNFVSKEYRVSDIKYKSKLTLREAAALYPEWYEKIVVNKKPKGTWVCKNGDKLYQWWLDRIKHEALVGHRFYCIMCLAIYAKKGGVDRKTLEQDAFSLLERMELLTVEEGNHFSREDILAALELYNDSYFTFPIDSITQLTSINIVKNKRNYKKQEEHLEKNARDSLAAINKRRKEKGLKCVQGRKSKQDLVENWQRNNPGRTKEEALEELKISTKTLYKYWKELEK